MNFVRLLLFIAVCTATPAISASDLNETEANLEEIAIDPQACPESDECPVENHAWGTGCPHRPS